MKSIQYYRNVYRNIASNLGIQGDSVELLVQLLAQHSYINEVENISYLKESSLESATLLNSKIQHCMNDMYSVYRGLCPRIVFRFVPTKTFTFVKHQEVAVSSNFSLYYLGYRPKELDSNGKIRYNEDGTPIFKDYFNYDSCTVYPDVVDSEDKLNIHEIEMILSPEKTSINETVNYVNTFYIDCTETDLSNDLYAYMVDGNNSYTELSITRDFGDHIINKTNVFDLTLPSYGSRLYIADSPVSSSSSSSSDSADTNVNVVAVYYKYSNLSSYNTNEIKKLSVSGMVFKDFEDTSTQLTKGIRTISETTRDTAYTLHYKANKDKYISSIVRSNDDICTLFKEKFIDKVAANGVSYTTNNNIIKINYILATNTTEDLTSKEISEFKKTAKAYYISDDIQLVETPLIAVSLSLEVVLYENSDSSDLDDSVLSVLNNYNRQFHDDSFVNIKKAIRGEIEKISCIRYVKEAEFNSTLTDEELDDVPFEITPTITVVS
jgi:hypothetical protein